MIFKITRSSIFYKIIRELYHTTILPLKLFITSFREYLHLKNLIKNAKKTELLKGKTILFNTVRNLRNSLDTELFIAITLALNGANVKFLLDDGVMMHWDSTRGYPEQKRIKRQHHNIFYFNNVFDKPFSKIFLSALLNRFIRKYALKILNIDNLDYIYYSTFTNKINPNYKNLEYLKGHALGSTIRHFKTNDLDFNNKYIKYYFLLSIKNASLSRATGQYVSKEIKPDLVIVPHGFYSTHGPFYESIKENRIKCFVWGGGNTHTADPNDASIFDVRPTNLTTSEHWKQFRKSNPLNDEMREKVEKWFKMRLEGKTIDFQQRKLIDTNHIKKVNKTKDYKYYIGMFPNVMFDANTQDRRKTFDGYLDWLISTINYIKTRKDVKLFIKAHPTEDYACRENEKVFSILRRYIDLDNIENLELIPPESKINTYELLKSGLDVGIVYDGILAIEIPYLGIPVITCVEGGHFHIEGGNYVAKTRDQYFEYLENIESLIQRFQEEYSSIKETISKFVYWYIYVNIIKVPTLRYYFKIGRAYLLHLNQDDLKLDNFLYKSIMDCTSKTS